MQQRETGTVKWFTEDKGYGFVTRDSGQKDVFLHISNWNHGSSDLPQPGEKISFEVEETDRGPQARDARRD